MFDDMELVSEIIREAGAIVLKHYEAGAGADTYKDGEPVTVADRESDAFIVSALRRAFPDDEIVSEESVDRVAGAHPGGGGEEARESEEPQDPSESPGRERSGSSEGAREPGKLEGAGGFELPGDRGSGPAFQLEHTPDAEPPSHEHAPPRVWYVDPMDGTSDFVQRTGDFVVMIGLAVAGWPVFGAVYHPPSDTLYRGGHGLPPEKIVGDQRTALQVSDVGAPGKTRLVVSRSHTPDVVAGIARSLGIEKMEKCGSVGLKAARVAEGAGELYLHPSIGTKLWDTCAPEAILVAAGGTFSDCDGKPLVYHPARYHNERGLVASNGRLHDDVVAAIAGVW